jgi:hypothetical protein
MPLVVKGMLGRMIHGISVTGVVVAVVGAIMAESTIEKCLINNHFIQKKIHVKYAEERFVITFSRLCKTPLVVNTEGVFLHSMLCC